MTVLPSAPRGRALASALLPLALAACGGGEPGRTRADVGPFRHVLLISVDTFRADRMGAYGAARATPHLDLLAQEGVRFAQATTAAPTTLAAHTALVTGTWPHTHGVPRNGFVVSPDNDTLAEVLHAAGFHTAAVLGSFALERRFGFDQGFEHFDERFDVLIDGRGNDQNQRLAGEVTRAALEHVDRVRDEVDRIFLFVHYFDAHAKYAPPPEYAERVSGNRDLTSDQGHVEAAVRTHQGAVLPPQLVPGHVGSIQQGFRGPLRALIGAATGEPNDYDRLLATCYDGEVAYIDDAVGELLGGLDERGLLDEMLVALVADHGETFWEHGDLWNHGLWVYQTTVHVPLVLRRPDGQWAGRVVEQPVSTIDLLPTLCELLGLAAPARSEGMSLVPLAEGRPFERGPIFTEATQPWIVENGTTGWKNSMKPQAVRLGPWKYVRCRYNQVEQLFHLGRDPGERNDLLAGAGLGPAAQAALAELRAALDAWDASARPLPSHFDTAQTDETAARLRELGYMGEQGGDDEEERPPK